MDAAGSGKPHAATSADTQFALEWVLQHADHQRKPFAIVDKRAASILVFESDGRLRGSSAVLLGRGSADASVADIATGQLNKLAPHEQTTPSGRFASEPGRNLQGEDIVWVDYEAKVAVHRLRADAGHARRALALASGGITDKRLSLGCIVMPVRFYEEVVRPALGGVHGVVHVLPEQQPARRLFDALRDAANL